MGCQKYDRPTMSAEQKGHDELGFVAAKEDPLIKNKFLKGYDYKGVEAEM